MQIVDFCNVRPDELKSGDVLVCTVTLHVGYRKDEHGKPMYRVYRCGYPPEIIVDGIPQGPNIGRDAEAVAHALFPVIGYAELQPD